ncbi:MAG: ankyrin repeat domain-containing protein [Chthoniobacter sp.]|nr:ankyrin repeat domain-containing protein [Chthoniobacter sp.]
MHPNDALIDAAKHGDCVAARDAPRRGADANAVIDQWTALLWAAQEGHTEIVDLLLDAGANVNFADSGGFTPLKQAVGESRIETMEHLLLRGADVSHRGATDGGCTALHTAAAYGRIECIRLLLLYGADVRALNDSGQTPYDVAIECEEADAAALLQSNKSA